MISQSDENYIYAANNKGLLEFNGARWTLYPSPNETIFRSVNAIKDRIYTGCYMDFGYWERNQLGRLEYTSLSAILTEPMVEDEQIWNIIDYDQWILFQSLNRIYLYNTVDETFSFISSDNTILKLFQSNGSFYFQVAGEGIYAIENKEKVLLSDDPIAREKVLVNLFERQGSLMALTAADGFFEIREGNFSEIPVPADPLLETVSIYNSITLENGHVVLGTIANGVIALSETGSVLYQMDQSSGLGDNTALSLFEDRQKNIWLGLDHGIDCINTQVPFSTYANRNGSLGTVYASIVHEGYLYLGTNQGLFSRPLDSNQAFQLVPGTEAQVWNLKIVDRMLFCGHHTGTFQIIGNSAQRIANVQGTWDIKKIPNRPNLLIQGNYDGLHILEKDGNSWRYRNKIADFHISSRFFEFTQDYEILVGHEYKGVFQLEVDNSYAQAIDFREVPSVSKGSHASLAKFNNTVYYAFKDGIYSFDNATNEFVREEQLSAIFSNDEYVSGKLVSDASGNLWAFTKNTLVQISTDKLNNAPKIRTIAIPAFLRTGLEGFENISFLGDQDYLVGTSSGYLRMDLSYPDDREQRVKINSASVGTVQGNMQLIPLDKFQEFATKENYLYFEFSTPDFNKFHLTEYQYRLVGLQEQWSSWSKTASKSYDNLPYGDYEFQVRSRIDARESLNTASFSFEIAKPWFASNTAIVGYIIGFILLLFAMHAFHRGYYRKQRERLLEKNERDMELKTLANQKEIIQLKNQSLNQEIESRNRELAISTMSMVKKNSILNDLKAELETITDLGKLPSVIRIINKNLNNEDDWKFFEKAFNHADKDFFKKVKELHPELTANDLRLCVYLRLNLSSKEIAPLFNISPRSVEIKRYRLRKKIDLPRNTNLNDYFISL